MEPHKAILTVTEAAHELRCSKAHLHNIISGKVRDLPPVPVLRLGRRRLIRLDALQTWLRSLDIREIEGQRLTGL
ncbi:MAG: helix-turn-helix domain-containing protein, partial [Acidobacteriaceae bacterium]|nr:helix-turn-helix domain-containing protein [Acidobacteriaceae bacterium]